MRTYGSSDDLQEPFCHGPAPEGKLLSFARNRAIGTNSVGNSSHMKYCFDPKPEAIAERQALYRDSSDSSAEPQMSATMSRVGGNAKAAARRRQGAPDDARR